MYAVDKLFLCECFAWEELFKKRLVSFCNGFGYGFDKSVDTITHFLWYLSCRHISFNCLAVFILICFHLNEIYIRNYLSVCDNRHNNRANCRSELCFELSKNVIEVCVIVIKLCYNEHCRLAHFLCKVISLVSTYTNAWFTWYSDEYATACGNALNSFALIIEHTGSIKKIYLELASFQRRKRCVNRTFSLYLIRGIIRNSVSVSYLAEPVSSSAFI